MQQRWWMASVMLVLSLAVKPLGIVLLMLGPLVYRPTLWRIALLVPLLLLTPFLAAPSEYVSQQMSSFWDDLGHCASVTENRFADLNGIARNIAGSERGWEIPAQPLRVIGAVAAALTALCWWLGGRRVDEPLRGYYLLTLGIGYLLLFNPMTESNGYIMLAPLAATCALYCMDVSKRQTAGWLMLMIALSVGIGGGVMRKVDPEFALWFKPLMAAAFIVLMSVVLFKREREGFSVSAGRAFPA